MDEDRLAIYQREGYFIEPSLFSSLEAENFKLHFMELRQKGEYPGDFKGMDLTSNDPLKRYPRMIHMHRWDDLSLRFLLDERINRCLTALLGCEPYAVQTMLYFKPAGARGQALHQDQFYLQVQPGTCMAAWLALDDCDEENGCMRIAPGTQHLPVLCTTQADTTQSFTDVTVPIPADLRIIPALMKAGDVMFFNGSLIHGSYPNTSQDRFRRALIGHYIMGDAKKVGQYYHPVLRMDGTAVELGVSEGGGPCGIWAEENGASRVFMAKKETEVASLHE